MEEVLLLLKNSTEYITLQFRFVLHYFITIQLNLNFNYHFSSR